MKTMKIAGVLLLSMILATKSMAQSEVKEQLTVPLSEPGKPFKLNVDLINGSIKVVGYEGKEVMIDVQSGGDKREGNRESRGSKVNVNVNVNGHSKGQDNTAGMKRLSTGNGLNMSAEEKNNHITVHSESWNKTINLAIRVPQNGATLKLSTVNNGDIHVSNVNGEMEISNVNGEVEITNVSGSVVANTINGNLIVTFKTIDPKAAMAFSTLNGKVDVTFPANVKANVKLKSDQGQIYSDFDVEVDKTLPKVKRTNERGMYKLSIEDWVQGKINGGGPEMMMKNMNGNIYVRKAK